MPELPEVTTTVNGIKKECIGYTIVDVWTDLAVNNPTRKDFYETIKYLPYFKDFKNKIIGKKIIDAKRRGKNILIELKDDTKKSSSKTLKQSSGKAILVHMKMTGHMMVGNYEYNKKENKWHVHKDETNTALHDPYNRFVHVVFSLSKNNKGKTSPQPLSKGKGQKHLVLCDSRKFAKVVLLENENHHKKHLGSHGPEPIDIDSKNEIPFNDFVKALDTAPASARPIKIFLMDTRTISGIGNIYSDELLFLAGVHPKSNWNKIPKEIRKLIHKSMLKVLKHGIDFGGDSMSDYRNIYGKRGEFQNKHNAYKKNKEPCSFTELKLGKKIKCPGTIMRTIITGRSSHFCPVHQKLYK